MIFRHLIGPASEHLALFSLQVPGALADFGFLCRTCRSPDQLNYVKREITRQRR